VYGNSFPSSTVRPVYNVAMSTAPSSEEMERTVEVRPLPIPAKVANALACLVPLSWPCHWQTVNQKEVVVSEYCGTVTNVREEAGLYFQPCCGLETKRASTSVQTLDLPSSKIVDKAGSPVLVSAIVNYQVEKPLEAIYNVADYDLYMQTNAQAVVKNVVGKHTYTQLKSDTEEVNRNLCAEMQPKVDIAGIKILSVALNELNYAPEIAASMLKKQSAGAMLEARELIVQGAVKIAQDAVAALESGGMVLNDQDKVKIVTNLLTVTCSDSDAQPTISL
jgi:regulator of protease activity HflC (stomatin/prohibitin superfamily)